MVVGSKAEEELWSMTREEVETELLKMQGTNQAGGQKAERHADDMTTE
jgi:hypothetical protein